MDFEKVTHILTAEGEKPYRIEQVRKAVFDTAVSSYDEITSIPAALRRKLAEETPLLSLQAAHVRVSEDQRAHKALLRLSDGSKVESVLLRSKPKSGWTACISCQVGCAIGCNFCATGLMGLKRNMKPEEITDQILFWRQYIRSNNLPERLDHIVYMGMGEPFHTFPSLASSLRTLLDPGLFAFAARHIAVSTAGIVPGIEKFVEEFPQVNLALSLHAASDGLRSQLVPLNRAYGLNELSRVLAEVLEKTRRKIFLEYVLLAGENDNRKRALELVEFVRSFERSDLLHVNLITWNPTATRHAAPGREAAVAFKEVLRRRGIRVTIRRNLGTDINGACGQLATDSLGPRRKGAAPVSLKSLEKKPLTGPRPAGWAKAKPKRKRFRKKGSARPK